MKIRTRWHTGLLVAGVGVLAAVRCGSSEPGPDASTGAGGRGVGVGGSGSGAGASGVGGRSIWYDAGNYLIACQSPADCNPVHPVCDATGHCSGCGKTEHCNDPDLACDTVTHLCVAVCTGDARCAPPTPHCGSQGYCVECASTTECGNPVLTCNDGHCTCPTGQTLCGGKCIDAQHDPTNCGFCGRTCKSEQACLLGVCLCRPDIDDACDICVDAKSDPRCCGSAVICSVGTKCQAGSCTAAPCGAGLTECTVANGTGCADLQTSNLNCGGCGKGCATTEVCVSGQCKTYTPAVGCAACPCDAVCAAVSASTCCTMDGAPFCVAGGTCPSTQH